MLALIESSVPRVAGGSAAPHDFMTADSFGWTYVASRDDLLAAGVCTPAHFPEGKKRTAWKHRNWPGRQWGLTKLKGGLWELRIERTPGERATFEAQQRSMAASRRSSEFTEERWKESQSHLLKMFLDGLTGAGIAGIFQLAERDQDTIQALGRRMLMVINAAAPDRIESLDVASDPSPAATLKAPLQLAWSATPSGERICRSGA